MRNQKLDKELSAAISPYHSFHGRNDFSNQRKKNGCIQSKNKVQVQIQRRRNRLQRIIQSRLTKP